MIFNKTKAHGISALLGVLYVASCLDPSHTYISYPMSLKALSLLVVSVGVTRVELGGEIGRDPVWFLDSYLVPCNNSFLGLPWHPQTAAPTSNTCLVLSLMF